MKQLQFEIDPNGKVTVKATGYPDNTCATDSKPFFDALGGTVETVKKEPSYNIRANTQQAKAKNR